MKSLFIFALCIPFLSYAQNLEIQNFNFDYKNPSGQGSASSFQYEKSGVQVSVDKIGKEFKLKAIGAVTTEYTLQNAPEVVETAEKMSIQNLNLTVVETLNFSVARAKFLGKEDRLDLQALSLECDRDRNQVEAVNQLIAGCIRKLKLRAERFDSLSEIIAKAISDEKEAVKNFRLQISNGKFNFSAGVSVGVPGTVKGKGDVSYSASEKRFAIRISEVKFGILNITGKVFDELQKNESENMKVKRPFVYLKL